MPSLVGPALPDGTLGLRPQPSLDGHGLSLRPWLLDDVPGVVEAYADPAIQHWHGWSVDPDEAAAMIDRWAQAWQEETGASWAVTDAGTDTLLGRIGMRDVILSDGRAELAYWVLPSARGRGVARLAVDVLTQWALADVGFHRLEILHSVHNAASCTVAQAAGYELEGTARSLVRHADGWHDMHIHTLINDD